MSNQINIWIVLGFLFVHWVADFVAQTDWMAQNKSKDWWPLIIHTGTYSAMTGVYMTLIIPYTKLSMIPQWVVITFLLHTVQDYFTSRLNARLWKEERRHDFFVSVGFDQFLHFSQLLLTYQILST